jgi:hypothetical protein
MAAVLFVACFSLPQGLDAREQRAASLEALEKRIQELQRNYERQIQELRRQLEELRSQSASEGKSSRERQAEVSGSGEGKERTGETAEAKPTKPQVVGTEKRPEKVRTAAEAILAERRGVLLPKGFLTVEPSINYSHFSRNLITISGFTLFEAIVIGRIQVEEVERDILTGALTFRYGLLDDLQLDVKFPYLYRRDRMVRPTATGGTIIEPVRVIDDRGLGDIEGGINFHLLHGRRWWPDVIINVRGKSRTGKDPYDLDTETVGGQELPTELPTGTGHYGFSSGLTLIKAADPVVFFGGISYYWNFERDVGGDFGKVDPGDSFEYILGMAVALSEKAALNLSFQNIFTWTTTQNGIELPESELNAASLFVGASYSISRYFSLYGSVGVGLTNDSPDFQFQFTVPITFSLF